MKKLLQYSNLFVIILGGRMWYLKFISVSTFPSLHPQMLWLGFTIGLIIPGIGMILNRNGEIAPYCLGSAVLSGIAILAASTYFHIYRTPAFLAAAGMTAMVYGLTAFFIRIKRTVKYADKAESKQTVSALTIALLAGLAIDLTLTRMTFIYFLILFPVGILARSYAQENQVSTLRIGLIILLEMFTLFMLHQYANGIIWVYELIPRDLIKKYYGIS